MSILQRYVTRSYVTAFLMAMVVLTFVLSIGLLLKAAQLVVRGLPASTLLSYLFVTIPETFTFTIPLAALVSALLVFGRLSADGEISAMRSCGVNLWSILLPLILFGLFLTALTVFINSKVAPRAYYERHRISNAAHHTDVLTLLEPGRFIEDFENMKVYFARKEGNVLYDLLVYDQSAGYQREIRANSAIVTITNNDLLLDMSNVRMEPFSKTEPGAATAGRLRHVIQDAMKASEYKPKVGGFSNEELNRSITNLTESITKSEAVLATRERDATNEEKIVTYAIRHEIRTFPEDLPVVVPSPAFLSEARSQLVRSRDLASNHVKELRKQKSEKMTELSRRFALGLTPIAFIMLGVPLGIRAQRKESNVGIAISLGVMILYYAFLIAAKSLAKHPEAYPHVIIWLPSVVCALIAFGLVRKNQ